MGEAFDKVARMLRLGYHEAADEHQYSAQARRVAEDLDWEPMRGHPGAVLETLAREGNDRAVRLPTPLERRGVSRAARDGPWRSLITSPRVETHGQGSTMFSYSGLKTAVLGQAQQVRTSHTRGVGSFGV